jgi:hypothetical protein
MSLHVVAYNMKRVINLVGAQKLLEAIYKSLDSSCVLFKVRLTAFSKQPAALMATGFHTASANCGQSVYRETASKEVAID